MVSFKKVAFIMMLMMLVVSFAACGNNDGNNSTTGTEAAENSEVTTTPEATATPEVTATSEATATPEATTVPAQSKPAEFSEWIFEDYESEDWDSKTIKYDFHYREKWSFGGVNGDEEMRYVTDYFKAFLCLYEDGTILGYYLNNVGMQEHMENMYDPNNRVQLMYAGYWEEEDGTITMYTMAKDEVNSPEYITTMVGLADEGETCFDFYARRISNTLASNPTERESAFHNNPYGLCYDGTVYYDTAKEQLDAINGKWDEEIE